jgi:RNA polymerase sigma-70 factor (ECF subfamily)
MTKLNEQIESVYRENTGKMLAYLFSLTKNISLAEEIWHDTIATAITQWPDFIPENKIAWLYKVARNKTIDKLRQQTVSLQKSRIIQALSLQNHEDENDGISKQQFGDEQLKLIFCCCHPALDIDKQIPLTLSIVCGLSTTQIAEALVMPRSTLEQRLTRAKRKLNDAGIPFSIPESDQLCERLNSVLKVIYLVFNASDNESRHEHAMVNGIDLAKEAIRLAEHLRNLMVGHAEVEGLQALMMFHYARTDARFNEAGELTLLGQQNRQLWDVPLISEADKLLTRALTRKKIGSYQLQAAIQGTHCLAVDAEHTDWRQIEALYHRAQCGGRYQFFEGPRRRIKSLKIMRRRTKTATLFFLSWCKS